MLVPEIDFILEDNAQMYTGNNVEISNTDINTWGTSGVNNRRIQGASLDGGRTFPTLFQSAEIDGRVVFYAADSVIAPNKQNYAVVASNTNFEHIWSSWRGQRWVNRANVDDALMSFQDLVDFHKEEVFSTFSLSSGSLNWIDENTLDLNDGSNSGQTLTLGLNDNYSMSFTYADSTTIVRGGGDNQAFTNRLLSLNWVQFTDASGDTIIVEDGVETEGARVHDASNEFATRNETVVREETVLTPNLTPTELNYRIIHVTQSDNVETNDVDESLNYWQVQQQLDTDKGWDYGGTKYDNQLDADNALDTVIEDRVNANNTVGQNNASQPPPPSKPKPKETEVPDWLGGAIIAGILIIALSMVIIGGIDGGE